MNARNLLRFRFFRRSVLTLAIACLVSLPLFGQTLYWDTNGTTAGSSNAGGAWTGNFWSTVSDGTGTPGAWVSNGNAIISAGTNATGTFTITVSGTQNVFGMSVEEGTVTFSGGTLNFNDSTPDFTVVSGLTTTVNSLITGTNGLRKYDFGTLVVSNNNTYTGATWVYRGVLSVNTLANGGVASGIGQASNAAGNLLIDNGATLRYTGATGSTNRNFTLGTGGGTLDASGTGAITWANTGFIGRSGTNTARTLTLTGTNTGDNTLAGLLSDNGSGATSLVKEGTGTWVLSNENIYTGGTTVNGGTLKLTNPGPPPDVGTIRGALTINAGGTVETAAVDAFGTLTGSKVDTVTINGGTLNNTSSGNLGWGIDYTLNNGATMRSNGGVDSNTATSVFVFGGNGGDPTTVTVTGTGTSQIAGRINLYGDNGNATTVIDVASGAALNITAGVTSANANPAGLTKAGAGAMTFSGGVANTYNGGTSVNDGTLELNKTAGVNAIGSGGLVIGDNVGAASSAAVALLASNQMAVTTNVTLNADGRLALGTSSQSLNGITGTGRIDLGTSGNLTLGANNATSTFDGTITGAGTLTKTGTGSLTLTQDSTFGSLSLEGGTLVLDDIDLSVGTLNINADSTIDFGTTGGSRIFAGVLNFLNTGVTLNIINWTKGVDEFFAEFWPGATHDLPNNGNTAPMNQIVFANWTPSDTGWDSYDNQIYPNVPEPSTYGMIFIGLSVAFVGYRRWRKSRIKPAA